MDCFSCRRRYEETTTEGVPPCDEPGGILEDGTCQFGFPVLDPENVLALEVWNDVAALGDRLALTLRDLDLSDYDRGDLLTKLRILADETRKYQKRKKEEAG